MPKVSGLVGAGAEPQETTLPAKQVPIPVKPNVGLTAEVERPNPNQVGVVVIPQSAQLLPSGGTGRPPPPGPPVVPVYGPPSSLGMFTLIILPLLRNGHWPSSSNIGHPLLTPEIVNKIAFIAYPPGLHRLLSIHFVRFALIAPVRSSKYKMPPPPPPHPPMLISIQFGRI